MLNAVGIMLPFSMPVALSPLPIIAVVMLLLAPGGVRCGIGFLLGRWLALAALSLAIAALSSRFVSQDASGDTSGWLRIGLGFLVLAGAAFVWSKRPRGDEAAALPGWMRSLDSMSPARALTLGMILTAVNVKELAFVIGAGVLIGTSGLTMKQSWITAAIFAALACVSIAFPVLSLAVAPDRSRAALTALRDWLVRNNSIIITIVLVAIAVMLIGDGLLLL